MKRLVLILLALAIAVPVLAGAPSPKHVNVAPFAEDETVYLAIRGKQTGMIYKTTYVTLQADQDVYIQFDATAELSGYYTGQESAAWGGGNYDYWMSDIVFCPADAQLTFKTEATYFTFITVGTPGAMDVWTEYE